MTYFQLPILEEVDKLDFQTSETKLKRDYDQIMRTFKEYIDLEANRKVSQSHA